MTKEQEEAIEYFENDINKRKQGRNYFVDYEQVMKYEETVLKELERLQEETIEKDKIKEKLEELQKEYKEALEENSTKAFILKCQISILEELLEGK